MKSFNKNLLPFLVLLLCFAGTVHAQEKQSDSEVTKVTIITKQVDGDGYEVVKKIIREGEEGTEYLSENIFHLGPDGENVDIDIQILEGDDDNTVIDFGGDDGNKQIEIMVDQEQGQKRIRIKGIEKDGETFDIDWEGEGEIPAEIQDKINKLECQEKSHQRKMKIMRGQHRSDKAFLGVVLKEEHTVIDGIEQKSAEKDLGIGVSEIVAGSAAEAAGLQANDLINSINGQVVGTAKELTDEIQKNKAGDQIKVGLLRDGKPLEIEATLKAREHTVRSYHWNNNRGEHHSFEDRSAFNVQSCKPFIGVYLNLSDREETGLNVRRVIPNTPADEVNLQVGDIITAIDQVEVSSHGALIVERDKHQPGDPFTLTYLREGVSQTVNATFPACEEKTLRSNTKVIIIEADEKEINAEEALPNDPFLIQESTLSLNDFSAYPNPTDGLVSLRFSAASKPTVITVTDIAGREIFREALNTFDGIYKQQIDLSNASEGTLLLNIRQEDQLFTDKIILKKND